MSKTVSNVEIEDVLASIRRLVSDDGRSKAARPAAPDPAPEPQQSDAPSAGEAPKPAAPERLILTPSQRVVEQDEQAEPTPAMAAVPESEPVPAEADVAEPGPVLLTEPAHVPTEVQAAETDIADDDVVKDADTEDALEAAEGKGLLAQLVREEIDNLLADLPEEPEEAEATPAEADADATRSAIFTHARAPEPQKAAAPEEDDPETETEAEPEWRTQQEPVSSPRAGLTLEEKIAELEAMIGASPEEWEGEPPGQGTNTAFTQSFGPALDWEDAPRADAIFQSRRAHDLARLAEDLDDELPADPASAPAPAISEEMLREMVSDMIRKELQGTLGERITRNVRKLVRREIQRALTTQDFG